MARIGGPEEGQGQDPLEESLRRLHAFHRGWLRAFVTAEERRVIEEDGITTEDEGLVRELLSIPQEDESKQRKVVIDMGVERSRSLLAQTLLPPVGGIDRVHLEQCDVARFRRSCLRVRVSRLSIGAAGMRLELSALAIMPRTGAGNPRRLIYWPGFVRVTDDVGTDYVQGQPPGTCPEMELESGGSRPRQTMAQYWWPAPPEKATKLTLTGARTLWIAEGVEAVRRLDFSREVEVGAGGCEILLRCAPYGMERYFGRFVWIKGLTVLGLRRTLKRFR